MNTFQSTGPPRRPATLAEAFEPEALPQQVVRRRFGPSAALGRAVIGIPVNAFQLLGLNPDMMQHYPLLVSWLLRMPRLIQPRYELKRLVPLMMLLSSIGAGCRYCTAHSCAVALGNDVPADAISLIVRDMRAWGSISDSTRTVHIPGVSADQVAAVREAGHALGQLPSTYTKGHRRRLERYFTSDQIEALVSGAVLMGWLNKLMDGLGVRLEADAVTTAEAVLGPAGWNPGRHLVDQVNVDYTSRIIGAAKPIRRLLSVAVPAQRAERAIGRWVAGVPAPKENLEEYMFAATGYRWPLLSQLNNRKTARAIATLLVDVLGARPARFTPRIGLAATAPLWRRYATVEAQGSPALEEMVSSLKDTGTSFGVRGQPMQHRTPLDDAVLSFGMASLSSPTNMPQRTVEAGRRLGAPNAIAALGVIGTASVIHRLDRALNPPS